ncbi:MAG TPA: hypothetical protein IGR64_14770, partial [Leptolyngbyaceae cyanobacterium M65_K2018_010]|nr:hypothetical protein [Leptolyngbyaceae cyanobacterium M65_K2018_010]
EAFVPLELNGAVTGEILAKSPKAWKQAWSPENLTIWDMLRRSQQDWVFRQMVNQTKGDMGKTTLMRHFALIYGQRKHRRHRAPKLVPSLLR